MSDTFDLNIVSHEGKLFNEKVAFFKCHSSTGEVGIFPEHSDSLILLESTDLVYQLADDTEKMLFVRNGILSIKSGNATVITDQLLMPNDIEVGSVKESISSFEKNINSSNSNEENEKYRKLILESEAKLRIIS